MTTAEILALHIFVILLILHQSQACSNDNRLIFSEDYNEADPPTVPKTAVEAGWRFKSFDSVDDSQKTFTFTARIYFHWRETRIRMKPEFNSLRKPRSFFSSIWSPTLTFKGQVDFNRVDFASKNYDILLENEGNETIWITTWFLARVKINCPDFEFHWFPLDQQICAVVLYPRIPDSTIDGQVDFATTFDINDAPLEYDVTHTTLQATDLPILPWSYLGTRLLFKRRTPPYNGYLIFSELIVCISWITYWVPHTSYPGRLAPLFVLLLTLVNTFIKVRGVVPTCMSSMTIIEIYILACIFQVLFVILAYAHILIAIHHLKTSVSSDGMDPNAIEEQKVLKINQCYRITSPILNICMWLVIALYSQLN